MNVAVPLRERVLAAVVATPSVTRRKARRRAALLLALAASIGLVVFELLGGLSRAGGRPLAVTGRLADGAALASAMLTWLVVGRGGRTLGRSPMVLLAAAIAEVAILYAWMRYFPDAPIAGTEHEDGLCLAATLAMAPAPLAAFLSLRKGSQPERPWMLGAAAGAASGGWANVVVLLSCPVADPSHVWSGHVLPIVLVALAGAALGGFSLGLHRVRADRGDAIV